MITARVSWRSFVAAIAALEEVGKLRSDPRALEAAEEFKRAQLEEVEREIEYANPPEPLPAFLRRQAD